MSEPFVDTDVITRLLTGDDLAKQAAAAGLFEKVEQGKLILHAPASVLADAVLVLASPRLYHVPRADVSAMLTRLVALLHFHARRARRRAESARCAARA
jgi:predicted nucleic acid-binding protein